MCAHNGWGNSWNDLLGLLKENSFDGDDNIGVLNPEGESGSTKCYLLNASCCREPSKLCLAIFWNGVNWT